MRHYFLEYLYRISVKIYTILFKAKEKSWNIKQEDLKKMKEGTLGHDMHLFLYNNKLKMQPKLESHDVFHVLTATPIDVPSEISMQFFVRANGKKSLYNVFTILIGTIIFPDKIGIFIQAYKKGKQANNFHNIDWENLLERQTDELRKKYNIIIFSSVFQVDLM